MHPLHRVGGALGGIVDGAAARAREQVLLARTVGKFAVDRALERMVDELRRQLTGPNGSDASSATMNADSHTATTTPGDEAATSSSATEDGTDRVGSVEVPTVDDLALPDYDHLPAAHVIAALADLEPDERDAIEAYERSGRHRRTILGKLDQLRAPAS